MKGIYDRSAKERGTFENKQKILFMNNTKWQHGQIESKHETPRSFVIRSDGRKYRRNTKHIRPFRERIMKICQIIRMLKVQPIENSLAVDVNFKINIDFLSVIFFGCHCN